MTVVFDTNGYRDLVFGISTDAARAKGRRLKICEAKLNIVALAHPIVMWELLAHLAVPTDPAYENCRNALVAAGEHVMAPNGGTPQIADSTATVCNELFERLPPGYEAGLESLGTYVTHVRKHSSDLNDAAFQQEAVRRREGMHAMEQDWLRRMEGVVNAVSPSAARSLVGKPNSPTDLAKAREYFSSPQFYDAWSRVVVLMHASQLGIVPTPAEVTRKAATVRAAFPVAFQLLKALMLRIATPTPPDLGSNKRRRWNFVWDSMICFMLGPGTIDGSKVLFVTGDKEITVAAQSAGFGSMVETLDSYLSRFGEFHAD